MIVRLNRDNDVLPVLPRGLLINREYLVLEVTSKHYRMFNGPGERDGPYLYQSVFFDVMDATVPDDWEVGVDEDGEPYAQPRAFGPYTWEDYFDRKPDAVRIVTAYLNRATCYWNVPANDRHPHERNSRFDILERLRFIASPLRQVTIGHQLDLEDMTELVLFNLSDISPDDLRNAREADAIRRVDDLAGSIWKELVDDRGMVPSITQFVKFPHSATLANAANEVLPLFESR